MRRKNIKITEVEIQQEVLEKIDVVDNERITENIGIAYDFLESQMHHFLRKTKNCKHNSYHIKRKIERITGFSISNLDLKYCMELLGVKKYYADSKGEFYFYPISEKWYKKIQRLADKKELEREEEDIDKNEMECTSEIYIYNLVKEIE